MKKSSVLFVLMAASGICFSSVYAQKRLVLDLNQTIALANDSSLESFRTQNMYLSGYWEYRRNSYCAQSRTVPASCRIRTETVPPAGVNLMALDSRLSKICPRRVRSQ